MPGGRRVDADGYGRAWRNIDDLTVALAMYAHSSDAADPSRISHCTRG